MSGASLTIIYLHRHDPPSGFPRERPTGARIHTVERPTVPFYRFVYDRVGEPWDWTDRKELRDDQLRGIIQHPDVELHVLFFRGTPAGYAELDYREPPDVQLAYFGLRRSFIGQGLGAFFLDWTIRTAFAPNRFAPNRLWLHTCTDDHPRALSLYRPFSFEIYRTEPDVGAQSSVEQVAEGVVYTTRIIFSD